MKRVFSVILGAGLALGLQAANLLDGVTSADLIQETGRAEVVTVNGKPALKLSGHTAELKGDTNRYVNFKLKLKSPLSLENRSLAVTVSSPLTPPGSGLYIRAYNAGDAARPVWSFQRWNNEVVTTAPRTYTVTGGQNGLFTWENAVVSGKKADQVDTLQFFYGSPDKNRPLELIISGIEDTARIDTAPKPKATAPAGDFAPTIFAGLNGGLSKINRSFSDLATFKAEGPDGIRMAFTREGNNNYAGLVFQLKEPLNLEDKALEFELSGNAPPAGLYIRLYNQGGTKPCWSFASWNALAKTEPQKLTVQRDNVRGMQKEKEVVDGSSATKIDRIEVIIGHREGSDKRDLLISGIKVAEPKESFAGLKTVAALTKVTRLAVDGKATAEILHPDTDAGRRAAAAIADAIAKTTGVKLTARPGTKADQVPAGTVIMLGNIFNNPAMLTTYARGGTLADAIFPGKAGYLVDTIVEPYKRGSDLLIVGASDDEGLALGAAKLAEIIAKHGKPGSLELPKLFEAVYAPPYEKAPAFTKDHIEKGLEEANRILAAGQHTSLGGYLATIGERYRLWRNPADAKLYVEVAKVYAASAKADPSKFGGAWGFDSDFRSFAAIGMWDLVEHDPVLTDADRLVATNMIARWLLEAIVAEAAGGKGGKGVVSNHLTFASLGALMGSLYFEKYYGEKLTEPKEWLDIVRHNFYRQIESAKAHDDCNGYQWLTWHHLLLYTTAMPDNRFLSNGYADKVLRGMLLTMDNLGYQVPYGDTGSWKCWFSEIICLNIFYAATGDPLAAYILGWKRKVNDQKSPGMFYAKLPAAAPEPAGFNGVQVFALDPAYFETSHGTVSELPLDKCFDKLSMREALNPAALYLLIDGVNNGGHKHADANSVLRHTQFDRIWLADNDYFKSQQKFHNTLLLVADGEAFALPDYIELLGKGDEKEYGWSSTRANNLGSANWTRHLIWLKPEKAYVALDVVRSSKDADLLLKQRWNGIGEVEKLADGVLFRQNGPAMRLQGQPETRFAMFDDEELGTNWAGYLHAPKVVRVVDQMLNRKVKAGESISVAAVWHGCDQGVVAPWNVANVPGGIAIETGKKRYTITADANDKLSVAAAPSNALIADTPPVTDDAAAATLGGTPLKIAWKEVRSRTGLFTFTGPAERKLFPFEFKGTEPKGQNIFIADASNKVECAIDGSGSDGADSVMYAPNEVATYEFTFAKPQEVSQVELNLWWANSSSKGVTFKLKTLEVYCDGKKVATVDATKSEYPNFGKPVLFQADFPKQNAKTVKAVLTPQAGSALYVGEIAVCGPAPLDAKIRNVFTEFTRVVAVPAKSGAFLAAGSLDGKLAFFGEDGKLRKELDLKSAINDLAVEDLDGDGNPEILVALQSGALMVLDTDGKELWTKKFDFYRVHPALTIVKVADLDGDGKKEILAGCDNWRVYAFDSKGKELWNYEVVHPTRAVEAFDLDGDGKKEVLCGTKYYMMSVLDAKGARKWAAHFGPGCRALAAPKADGKTYVAAGSDDGNVYFFTPDGKLLAKFVTGDEVRSLVAVPDGANDTVFAGSFNGFVYRFTPSGKLLSFTAIPGNVTRLLPLSDGAVLAGSSEGYLCRIDRHGAITGSIKFSGSISDLKINKKSTIVTTSRGEIAKVDVE
ncbi:MAG: FG-GAP-like repeat-containing protein [Victivallaceae bacterium]